MPLLCYPVPTFMAVQVDLEVGFDPVLGTTPKVRASKDSLEVSFDWVEHEEHVHQVDPIVKLVSISMVMVRLR